MCGFFISNNPRVNQSHLEIMEKTLRFRGPDCSSGLVERNGWKAYHSRLAIIDLSSGVNQPVVNDNKGMLVFNGEILNYKELGYKYFDKEYMSDTLLLADLLYSKKINLDELDGFFAFVYIDEFGQLRQAARDKFGVKPIYYHIDGQYLTFCSEPITLKQVLNLDVNEKSIDEYRAVRAPIFSNSYFNGVQSIGPGNCLVDGEYFNCEHFLQSEYEDVDCEVLEKELYKGIKTRLVSDAPVGLLLSKGIDSNLLKEVGRIDRCYSIGFTGDEDIEYLERQDIPGLTIVKSTEKSYLSDFSYLLELRGEPMSVPNEILLYQVAKEASGDGVKVLLSGEGADEFFGGYDRIFKWASEIDEFDLDTFINMYCYLPPKKGSTVYTEFKKLFEKVRLKNAFELVRWFFIRFHMPILFRRLDFSLMAAGVEGREPIANYHIFNIASKMSSKKLMGNSLGKMPLRKIISKYKGDGFAYDKKIGFPVDLTKVFENEENLSSYDLWFKENIKVLYK